MLPGGPVAILAGFIFLMYKKDRTNSENCMRSDRIFMEDRLTRMIKEDQKSREENTVAITTLSVILKELKEVVSDCSRTNIQERKGQ